VVIDTPSVVASVVASSGRAVGRGRPRRRCRNLPPGAALPAHAGYRRPIAPTARFPIHFARAYAPLAAVLGAGRRRSWLAVGDDEVVVRMGWAFRARVPRAAIVSARPHPRVRFALGVHIVRRGTWIVNGSFDRIVELCIDPPPRVWSAGFPVRLRRLLVSVAAPDELVAALGVPSAPAGGVPATPADGHTAANG
jgi:hypothetical protein